MEVDPSVECVPAGDVSAIPADALTPLGIEQIERDSQVAITEAYTSCFWIQNDTFGYGINATKVYVHKGSGGSSSAPLTVDGKEVRVKRKATAADLDAVLSGGKRATLPEEMEVEAY
jgi:hypothetical protein